MKTQRISSIGWLNGINDTIILTPCLDGLGRAYKVTISRTEFESIRHDKELLKKKAAELLNL